MFEGGCVRLCSTEGEFFEREIRVVALQVHAEAAFVGASVTLRVLERDAVYRADGAFGVQDRRVAWQRQGFGEPGFGQDGFEFFLALRELQPVRAVQQFVERSGQVAFKDAGNERVVDVRFLEHDRLVVGEAQSDNHSDHAARTEAEGSSDGSSRGFEAGGEQFRACMDSSVTHVFGEAGDACEWLFNFGGGWVRTASLAAHQPAFKLEFLDGLAHGGAGDVEGFAEFAFAGQGSVVGPLAAGKTLLDVGAQLSVERNRAAWVEFEVIVWVHGDLFAGVLEERFRHPVVRTIKAGFGSKHKLETQLQDGPQYAIWQSLTFCNLAHFTPNMTA